MGMAYLAKEQEGQVSAAVLGWRESVPFSSLPSALPWQWWRKLFFMFWNSKCWLSLQIFPSCLVASTEAWREEEKLAPMAAACAFEAGRAAFPHLSPVTFWMTLAYSGVTTIKTRLTGLLQQCRFQIYCEEIGEVQHSVLPGEEMTKAHTPSSRIAADFPMHGLSPFNTSPVLFSVLQACLLSNRSL